MSEQRNTYSLIPRPDLGREKPQLRAEFHGRDAMTVRCECDRWLFVQPTDTLVRCAWCGRAYEVRRST